MKKAAVIIGVLCLLAGAVQADIGVRGRSDGGLFDAGSSWVAGPWPDTGALYQLIWSPTAPIVRDITVAEAGAGLAGEEILLSGAAGSYGYVPPTALVERFDPSYNAGYIIMRIFQHATVAEGDMLYQSMAPTGPGLPEYNPSVPSSVFDHFSTDGGAPQAMNAQVIPEPATLALWGLGLLTIVVRRKIRR